MPEDAEFLLSACAVIALTKLRFSGLDALAGPDYTLSRLAFELSVQRRSFHRCDRSVWEPVRLPKVRMDSSRFSHSIRLRLSDQSRKFLFPPK